jgi:maleate isomerase
MISRKQPSTTLEEGRLSRARVNGSTAGSEDRLTKAVSPRFPIRYKAPIERIERSPETAIGVIVPFDFELDWEYWRYLPPGVSLYFTRTPHVNRPVGISLAKDVGKPTMVKRATRALNALQPALTLYACSSGSFIRGLEGERQLRQAMLDAGARRAVTTSGGMLEAFRACGAQRIAVATPYTERLTMALVDFIEAAGFNVVSAHYLGTSTDIVSVSKATVANLVREASRPEADVVFLSCTALRTYGIVAELEEELDCPVLTSNQVSFWAGLHHADALVPSLEQGDGWVLGGGDPIARSTQLLIDAAVAGHELAAS